jgi:hypothetical protein
MDVKEIYKLVHSEKIDMPQLCRERSATVPPVLSSVTMFLPPYAVKEGEAWTVSNIW